MRVYQRAGSPYWYYDFTWNGNRYRDSTKETDRRDAKIVAHAALAEVKTRPGRADRWAITHVIATWWDEHAQHTDSSDEIWSNIENLERCLDCRTMLNDLTYPMMLDFRAKRRGEGVCGPTINRDIAYLRAAINHAADMHGKSPPPINWKLLRYPENPWRVRFLSGEEYMRLITAAHDDLVPIITAGVTTGLRKANLIGDTQRNKPKLQWHQVDLTGGTITIPKAKGHKPVVVGISPLLRQELMKIRKSKGDVFNTTNFKRRWQAAVEGAELVDFRFHDLRHTFGTWSRKGGVDLFALRNAMNHSSIAMTMRYAHVTDDEAVTAFDKAERTLQALTQISENGTNRGTTAKKKA